MGKIKCRECEWKARFKVQSLGSKDIYMPTVNSCGRHLAAIVQENEGSVIVRNINGEKS